MGVVELLVSDTLPDIPGKYIDSFEDVKLLELAGLNGQYSGASLAVIKKRSGNQTKTTHWPDGVHEEHFKYAHVVLPYRIPDKFDSVMSSGVYVDLSDTQLCEKARLLLETLVERLAAHKQQHLVIASEKLFADTVKEFFRAHKYEVRLHHPQTI